MITKKLIMLNILVMVFLAIIFEYFNEETQSEQQLFGLESFSNVEITVEKLSAKLKESLSGKVIAFDKQQAEGVRLIFTKGS